MDTLHKIGQQLDRNITLFVKNGGIVVPNTIPVSLLNLGVEVKNEKQRTKRSETRTWPRPIRGQRPASRSWKTCQPASVVSAAIKSTYEQEVDELKRIYPNSKVWLEEEGMWLLTESAVLPEHLRKAIFFTGISFRYPFRVRSWGFWKGGLRGEPTWIGPRHTNFPDGSVCAFEPTDRTWLIGNPLVKLLDLYTVWALRHLHLEIFGRWPGHQAVFLPCERIMELREDEFCGCGMFDKLYGECCQEKDLARDRVADAVDFCLYTGGEPRKPPDSILKFIYRKTDPPPTSELLV